MKQIKHKKSLVLVIIMILCLHMGVYAAVNGDFNISGIIESSGNITEGDSLLYKLTIDNVSGTDFTGVNVYVSGDFSLASGSSFAFGDITDAEAAVVKSIPIVYDGTGNKLNVLVDDGAGHSIIENITVGNVVETNTSTPTPVDKDRLYSEFNLLLKDTVPTFYAGQTQKFEFDLENTTTYYSKEVRVQLLNNSLEFPFDDSVNKIMTTPEIFNSREKKTVSLNVTTNANVASGFYTVPAKITYKNVYGLDASITKNIQVEVVNRQTPPTFIVYDILKSNELLIPGSDNLVQLTLKNLGTLDAKNLKITLEGLDINGITLTGDTPTKTITNFGAGDTDFVIYNINISDDILLNKKELSLKLSYYDAYGATYTDTLPVYLDIEQASSSLYDFDVTTTSMPSRVLPEQEFKIKFDVTNNSGMDQKDLKLSIKSDGNFIYKSQPIIMIKDIKSGEKLSYEFMLIADKNMTSNNYPTYISIAGKTGDPLETYLGIYVDGDSGASSKPKIIIDKYDIGSENILAGETFDLAITFFNTSNSIGIQNAKVSISSDEGAFVPVNASSSFFIESIGLREKVTHVIKMKAKSDLNIKTYNITAAIEYEDSKGNSYDKNNVAYTANESMAIPVMQELRLEVEELSVQPFGFVYQPTELYVEFFNMGKASLSNMMVKTEGDFDIQDSKYFVGNFGPGTNDYYSCTLIPLITGQNTGTVIFQFEDALGEQHTVEKTFSIEASEMEMNFQEGEMINYEEFEQMPEEPKKSKVVLIVVVILILVVLSVILIVVRKKIKTKKEMALDE